MRPFPRTRSLWFYITALLAVGVAYMWLRRFTTKSVKMAAPQQTATKPSMENKNVLQKPLGLFSKQPMTGFYRDGYCRTSPEDSGNHSVAGVMTEEFLNFTASRGNNLRSVGLTPGCKWCLCASRWKEAMDAAKSKDDPVVPKVYLHATHESALDVVKLEDLKKFAHEGELV